MANEIRLRRNNIAGTITDNPLGVGATTINSPGFVDLPTVDATNHLLLILDPLEVGGTAEIVMVTAHTAAATSVTVIRGMEGSVARSHVTGTTWFHGPVASDFALSDVTSSTRPTTPYTGELIFETDTKKLMGYTGTNWAPRDAGGQLGYAQVTADQTFTVAADATGLSVNVTVGTGRRIKITSQTLWDNENAGANMVFWRIQEGGTVIQQADVPLAANGANGELCSSASSIVISPTAGAHTYKIAMAANLFNVVLRAGATVPAFILVEDIGAV